MEKQAFDLVHQGHHEAATDLLLSSEYEKQKEIYSQGLSEATDALKKYVEANIRAKSQQAFSALVIIGVALGILLFAWIGVLRMMKRYIQAINDTGIAISTSSYEIATTVEQQERTITQQASSVNQTTTTMDELDAFSRQSAEQAEASAAGAQMALTQAEEGTIAVQETMGGNVYTGRES
jgi:methyl-accepting chemotaxis protein